MYLQPVRPSSYRHRNSIVSTKPVSPSPSHPTRQPLPNLQKLKILEHPFRNGRPSGILASLPAELVVRIFQDCNSFADLRALLLTCRYAHSVWVANIPSIIWNVAPKLIPAFDRGLIAVCNVLATVHSRYPADGGS